MTDAASWEAGGDRIEVGGHRVWYRVDRADAPADHPPLLALHGFPTSSLDLALALPQLAAARDVISLDYPGFGCSDKPDVRYGIRLYADAVEAVLAHLDVDEIDLLTHDLGDSVGGELLARTLDGSSGLKVRRRVVTNGSIYLDLAQLTIGQQLLLGLPDAREPMVGDDGGVAFRAGVVGTFAADTEPGPELDGLLDQIVVLAARDGGLSVLPRTIRYIEDRRAEERRFTGAIEEHPSPVGLVWGDQDPVAVHAMAERFVSAVPSTPLTTLAGIGHYPMLEAPGPFAQAVLAHLDG